MKKEYRIKKKAARMEVDLREHESAIQDGWRIVAPNVKIEVFSDKYIAEGDFTDGQAREAGRHAAHAGLGQYCLRYKYNGGTSTQLFVGKEIE